MPDTGISDTALLYVLLFLPVNATDRATVHCLLNLLLGSTGRIVYLRQISIIEAKHLGCTVNTETATDAGILVYKRNSCHGNCSPFLYPFSKKLFSAPQNRADPTIRKVLEGVPGSNAVLRITEFGVILIITDRTNIFFHLSSLLP